MGEEDQVVVNMFTDRLSATAHTTLTNSQHVLKIRQTHFQISSTKLQDFFTEPQEVEFEFISAILSPYTHNLVEEHF